MSKGEVLMVLASQFQPNKIANATEIVGELTQDRHSGIMGVLGQESGMIPVSVNVRTFAGGLVCAGGRRSGSPAGVRLLSSAPIWAGTKLGTLLHAAVAN